MSAYPLLLCVRGYPAEIRDALVGAAAEAGVSANDYAVRVLAEIYNVPFEGGKRSLRAMRSDEFAGREGVGRAPGSTLQLHLPSQLNYRIHERALQRRCFMRDLVLDHLARHLGLEYTRPVIKRGRPRKKVAV
jgi:hypothetical protein